MIKASRTIDGSYIVAIRVASHSKGVASFYITEMNLGMSKPYWVLTNLHGIEIIDANTKKALMQYLATRSDEALIKLDTQQ